MKELYERLKTISGQDDVNIKIHCDLSMFSKEPNNYTVTTNALPGMIASGRTQKEALNDFKALVSLAEFVYQNNL